ncbi:MAG: hypothetical protein RR295_04730 [Oscillospiraceae bacterium]
MSKKTSTDGFPTLRLDPQETLCPQFDSMSIALFPVAKPGEMGLPIVDDCCFEHRM